MLLFIKYVVFLKTTAFLWRVSYLIPVIPAYSLKLNCNDKIYGTEGRGPRKTMSKNVRGLDILGYSYSSLTKAFFNNSVIAVYYIRLKASTFHSSRIDKEATGRLEDKNVITLRSINKV